MIFLIIKDHNLGQLYKTVDTIDLWLIDLYSIKRGTWFHSWGYSLLCITMWNQFLFPIKSDIGWKNSNVILLSSDASCVWCIFLNESKRIWKIFDLITWPDFIDYMPENLSTKACAQRHNYGRQRELVLNWFD